MSDELEPKVDARLRKRDGRRAARGKALMRTGLSKTFQTVLEIHRKRAEEIRDRQEREGLQGKKKRKGA
jgi:hypothetical protein